MTEQRAGSGLHRRSLLFAAAAASASAACGAGQAHTASTFRNSTSLSPFAEYLLNVGVSFTDGRQTARNAEQLQRMFVSHGATEVYARMSTRRGFRQELGDHSIQRALDRARMARAIGIPLNPEIGLFSYYGDVSHQPEPDFSDYPEITLPRPWMEMSVDEMLPPLRAYGQSLATEILATGVTVNYWDIGNEVEYGSAGVAIRSLIQEKSGWTYRPPDAVDPAIGQTTLVQLLMMPEAERIAWLSQHLWPHLGRMFAAVAEGIRAVDPAARFSTHLSGVSAYSAPTLIAFFNTMDAAGFVVDQLGGSYYPSSSAEPADRFEAFKHMAETVHATLSRQLFVAEFAYPVGPFSFGTDNWDHAVAPYEISVQGQADYLRDVAAWGARTGHLAGIRPWAPEITAPEWEAMSLFDMEGAVATARPSLSSIQRGVTQG